MLPLWGMAITGMDIPVADMVVDVIADTAIDKAMSQVATAAAGMNMTGDMIFTMNIITIIT